MRVQSVSIKYECSASSGQVAPLEAVSGLQQRIPGRPTRSRPRSTTARHRDRQSGGARRPTGELVVPQTQDQPATGSQLDCKVGSAAGRSAGTNGRTCHYADHGTTYKDNALAAGAAADAG